MMNRGHLCLAVALLIGLLSLGCGPATPTPTEYQRETPTATAATAATATPLPAGAIVHTVEVGETLLQIAMDYGVTVEQIRRLNEGAIGEDNRVLVGQQLVISLTGGDSTPPPGTATPTPTVPAGLAIHHFRATVDEAAPGDTVTLEWASSGGTSATLYHLPPSLQLPQSGWDVPTTGSYDYDIPADERNVAQFVLFVFDENGAYASASISVGLTCPDVWFFSPEPEVCGSAQVIRDGAEQHFEHGTMIWVEDPWSGGPDYVFVLHDDDQSTTKWQAFADDWTESLPESDPSITPPAGLFQPRRGFGLVWREQPSVRDRLGWATDEETGFTTIVQSTTLYKYNSIYIRAVDGNVWLLGPERGSWEKLIVQ